MPLKNLLHASFLVTLKCHKHEQIGTARVQRRQGVGNPWKTTSSKGFYRKMQFGTITLEKVGRPEMCDPPPLSGLLKKYSFFDITIGPPLLNKLRTKKLSGLFSTSWARTAHHPGQNFWIHACTHVADNHARVCTCILLICMFCIW